jgi:hypothetical protein
MNRQTSGVVSEVCIKPGRVHAQNFFLGNLLIVRSDPGDYLDPASCTALSRAASISGSWYRMAGMRQWRLRVLVDLARVLLDDDLVHQHLGTPRMARSATRARKATVAVPSSPRHSASARVDSPKDRASDADAPYGFAARSMIASG